jgi:hypothetical protein
MKRKWTVLLIVMTIVTSTAPAFAEITQSDVVVIDVALIRPVGIVSVVVGTALFILSLPVSIPSGSVGIVADRLVKDSFEYTFIRPVGNFDYELGTWGKKALSSSENSGPAGPKRRCDADFGEIFSEPVWGCQRIRPRGAPVAAAA